MMLRLATSFLLAAAIVFSSSGFAQSTRPARPSAAETAPKKEEKPKPKPDRWLHIKNTDVYPITASPLRGAEILIKNGKIEAIGHGLGAPEEAEVLDAMGLRSYPGLVGLNSGGLIASGRGDPGHNADPFSLHTALALAHGITTVVQGTTAVKFVAEDDLENAVLRRGLYMGLFYSSTRPSQKAQLRADLRKARDYVRAKTSGASSGSSSRGASQRRGGSRPSGASSRKRSSGSSGASSLGRASKYVPLFEGKTVAVFNVSDAHAILDVCELVESLGFPAVIRGATEGWTVAGDMGRAGVMAILTPRERRDPDETVNRSTGSTMDNGRVLWEHGVPVAVATASQMADLDGQPGRDALAVAWEAASMVRGGLPESAALEACTINAARCYGLDDRIGSLEPGKDADIVIVDGEILHYATMVQWAIVNGRVAYDKEKTTFLRHIRSRDPAFEKPAQWWPRPFGPMPDEWDFDPRESAKKKVDEWEAARKKKAEAKKAEEAKPSAKKRSESRPRNRRMPRRRRP